MKRLLILLLLVGILFSATPITSCQTISSSGEYYLANDLSHSGSGACIEIDADNVVLDGRGHTITGDGNGYGILLYRISNSIIENTSIKNFDYGIYFSYSSNNNLSSISATSNNVGFYLYGYSGIAYNNTIKNSNASNNGVGVYLYYASNNTFVNDTVLSNSQYGFYLRRTSLNNLSNNTIAENSEWDIYLDGSVTCSNSIKDNVGSDNKPILFCDSTVDISSKSVSELILCDADNSTLSYITVAGSNTKRNNGVIICCTDNAKLSYISSSGNYYGFYILSSSNNSISNSTSIYNDHDNFYLVDSDYNKLINNTASNSLYGYGFYLRSSEYNVLLENIIEQNHVDGIYLLLYSHGNTITSNTIANNRMGINAERSSYNTISTNEIKSNYDSGIFLYLSNSNTITNNNISYSTTRSGIEVEYSGDNLIYNNFLNNTNNVYVLGTYTNYWNISLSSGTNIVGGNLLGGNFYAKPDGSGYSETCTDSDGNGICDSPYTINSNNIDYYPLTYPAYSSSANLILSPSYLNTDVLGTHYFTLKNNGTSTINNINCYALNGNLITSVNPQNISSLDANQSTTIEVEIFSTHSAIDYLECSAGSDKTNATIVYNQQLLSFFGGGDSGNETTEGTGSSESTPLDDFIDAISSGDIGKIIPAFLKLVLWLILLLLCLLERQICIFPLWVIIVIVAAISYVEDTRKKRRRKRPSDKTLALIAISILLLTLKLLGINFCLL